MCVSMALFDIYFDYVVFFIVFLVIYHEFNPIVVNMDSRTRVFVMIILFNVMKSATTQAR